MANLSDYLDNEFRVVIGDTILAHFLQADDLISISDSIDRLRKQLEGLNKFCSKNQMLVNFIKTKVMVFGSSCEINVEFNGHVIEQVNEYKYLGCIFNSIQKAGADNFRNNYGHLCDQARKAIFSVKRRLSKIGRLPPETMFYLFNSLIKPILTYASDI